MVIILHRDWRVSRKASGVTAALWTVIVLIVLFVVAVLIILMMVPRGREHARMVGCESNLGASSGTRSSSFTDQMEHRLLCRGWRGLRRSDSVRRGAVAEERAADDARDARAT